MIEYELPFPPSVNHYYRHVGHRVLISSKGRAFRNKVCSVLASTGAELLKGHLKVQIELYPKDKRKFDIDNYLKGLLDALEHGGAYQNDNQIKKLEIEKYEPVPGGRTVVRIWKI